MFTAHKTFYFLLVIIIPKKWSKTIYWVKSRNIIVFNNSPDTNRISDIVSLQHCLFTPFYPSLLPLWNHFLHCFIASKHTSLNWKSNDTTCKLFTTSIMLQFSLLIKFRLSGGRNRGISCTNAHTLKSHTDIQIEDIFSISGASRAYATDFMAPSGAFTSRLWELS